MIFNEANEQLVNLKTIFTATEIHQQPTTWSKTIKQIAQIRVELQKFIDNVITKEDFDVILTGAGTSEFVGNTCFSYLNKKLKYKVKSYATTDICATPENYLSQTKPTLLISFGRSGNSPESIGAVDIAEAVCNSNVYHLFITCNKKGALSEATKVMHNCFAINLSDETHDQSFAMTSSFTNMLLAVIATFELNDYETFTKNMEEVINTSSKLVDENFNEIKKIVDAYDFNRIVYLGSNALKGISQESSLKMLELTAGKVVTMYDTPLGFRHGPKSIINDQTLTVIYLSDDEYTHKYEIDLIKEMSIQRKGNKILAISNIKDTEVQGLVDFYYAFNNTSPLNSIYNAFNNIIVAQLIAYYKALSYKITLDNPCPTGEVNRVVKGVTIYPYTKR